VSARHTREVLTATDQMYGHPNDRCSELSIDLVWPSGVRRDASLPLLVYLDLNHWVGLTKAATGHRDGTRYQLLLEACRTARRTEAALFPLSATHYMEVAKIADARRRADLAVILEELAGFHTLLARSAVVELEFETALDRLVRPNPFPPESVDLIDLGVCHALGRRLNFRVVDLAGEPVGDDVLQQLHTDEFDAVLAEELLEFERAVLAGPSDEGAAASLRQRGWQPDAAMRIAQERAEEQAAQARRFDAKTRGSRGWARDVVAAHETVTELLELLNKGLVRRGLSPSDYLAERIRDVVYSMPVMRTSIELKTIFHRNPQMRWTSNTIFDIDAMSIAVPYCDIVVTDSAAHRALQQTGLADQMNTEVFRRPSELADRLAP
jgi:hypothetical protein